MSKLALQGIPAAEGVASGTAWLYRARGVDFESTSSDAQNLQPGSGPSAASLDNEMARFVDAKGVVSRQLEELTSQFGSEQQDVGEIFGAQALMLEDPGLGECVLELVQGGAGAEEAVRRCGERFACQLERAPSSTIRERATDCREVADRILGALVHETTVQAEPDLVGRVIVARELPPGEAVRMLRAGAVALVLEHGGTTSHTAIVARALGVPAVVGIPDPLTAIGADSPIVVDGTEGWVRDTVGSQPAISPVSKVATSAPAVSGPCTTADGVRIHLAANIELPEELELMTTNGAEGIGLYRSEFLLMETDPGLPSEESQIERYQQLLCSAGRYDVVIRTYDLGGRKLAREVLATQDAHPSLGLRGIRILNLRRHLFHTQVRAALRASAELTSAQRGRLRFLLPMVSTVGEVKEFRNFLAATVEELGLKETPEVGAMIETPAAAATSQALGEAADFLAIGTNDLVQYATAAERDNEHVAHLYQPYHPGAMKLVQLAVEGAERAGVQISVCGEIASEPRGQVALIGLGVRRLSMHPAKIPQAKGLIQSLNCSKLDAAASNWLGSTSSEEVVAMLSQETEREKEQPRVPGAGEP